MHMREGGASQVCTIELDSCFCLLRYNCSLCMQLFLMHAYLLAYMLSAQASDSTWWLSTRSDSPQDACMLRNMWQRT